MIFRSKLCFQDGEHLGVIQPVAVWQLDLAPQKSFAAIQIADGSGQRLLFNRAVGVEDFGGSNGCQQTDDDHHTDDFNQCKPIAIM